MQQRLYNLDGLRFIAALMVVVAHIESVKKATGLPFFSSRFIQTIAPLAVTFFFVLSGFLIAWLLIKEKISRPDGRISVWHFYKKRILRIWPLYYLLVVVVFLGIGRMDFFSISYGQNNVYGSREYWEKFAGYLAFFPNFAGMKYGGFVYISQAWSLGVEEFFYLFFPLAILFIKTSQIRTFLLVVLFLSLLFSVGIQYMLPVPRGLAAYVYAYATSYRLYSFVLGALAAFYYLNPGKLKLKLFSNKPLIRVGIALLIILLLAGITFSFFTQAAYSVFFAMLLLALCTSGMRLWGINAAFIQYLGKISYGIYMLHPLAIVLTMKLMIKYTGQTAGLSFNILLYVLTTGVTIVLAALSYETYEKFFLRYARRKKDIAD